MKRAPLPTCQRQYSAQGQPKDGGKGQQGGGDSEERIAGLTKTAISVATPHHGTPLANHFATIQGQTLLLVLSALATSGHGRGAILAAAKAIALIARLDD